MLNWLRKHGWFDRRKNPPNTESMQTDRIGDIPYDAVDADTEARAKYVEANVIDKVYSDDKTDEEIVIDGFWEMFDQEEKAFAEYRRRRNKRHGR